MNLLHGNSVLCYCSALFHQRLGKNTCPSLLAGVKAGHALEPCMGQAGRRVRAGLYSIILKIYRAGASNYWAGPVSIQPVKLAGSLTFNASVVHILPLHGRTCLFASPVGVNCL